MVRSIATVVNGSLEGILNRLTAFDQRALGDRGDAAAPASCRPACGSSAAGRRAACRALPCMSTRSTQPSSAAGSAKFGVDRLAARPSCRGSAGALAEQVLDHATRQGVGRPRCARGTPAGTGCRSRSSRSPLSTRKSMISSSLHVEQRRQLGARRDDVVEVDRRGGEVAHRGRASGAAPRRPRRACRG